MFYLCYLYVVTYTGVKHDFHITLRSCRSSVTRWVLLVEQELFILSGPGLLNELGSWII
jgi:hypothetical protein